MLKLNTFKLINLINLFIATHKEQGWVFLSTCLMCTNGNVSGKQNKWTIQSLVLTLSDVTGTAGSHLLMD